jgi:hypothetical protein
MPFLIRADRPLTIIKTPPVTALASSDEYAHATSSFDLLKKTSRMSCIGNFRAHANLFSSRMPLRNVFAPVHFGYVCIKAPGTDFIIPPVYAQTAPFVQTMVDYHYSSDKVQAHNRDGSEYCNLIVLQALMGVVGKPMGVFNRHLDMRAMDKAENKETTENKEDDTLAFSAKQKEVGDNARLLVTERYVASDVATTAFFDMDLDFTDEERALIKDNEKEWNKLVDSKMSQTGGDKIRRLRPYEVAHFTNTTPHSQFQEAGIYMRTLTTGVISSNLITPEQEIAKNPYLAAALIRPASGMVLRP